MLRLQPQEQALRHLPRILANSRCMNRTCESPDRTMDRPVSNSRTWSSSSLLCAHIVVIQSHVRSSVQTALISEHLHITCAACSSRERVPGPRPLTLTHESAGQPPGSGSDMEFRSSKPAGSPPGLACCIHPGAQGSLRLACDPSRRTFAAWRWPTGQPAVLGCSYPAARAFPLARRHSAAKCCWPPASRDEASASPTQQIPVPESLVRMAARLQSSSALPL